MKYLVAEAAGFLGGRLMARLCQRGSSVVALGRDRAKCDTLLRLGVPTIQADLGELGAAAAFRGTDVVSHTSALSAPWAKYGDFFSANVAGTRNVIHACLNHGVGKLVHVSSPSVIFDNHDQVDVDESIPYPKRFLSPYCLTKKLAADLVNKARRELPSLLCHPHPWMVPLGHGICSSNSRCLAEFSISRLFALLSSDRIFACKPHGLGRVGICGSSYIADIAANREN